MKYTLFVHTYHDIDGTIEHDNQFTILAESDDFDKLVSILKAVEALWSDKVFHHKGIESPVCEFYIAHDGNYHKRIFAYEIDEAEEDH